MVKNNQWSMTSQILFKYFDGIVPIVILHKATVRVLGEKNVTSLVEPEYKILQIP